LVFYTHEDIKQGAKVLALFLDPKMPKEMPFAAVRERALEFLAPERLERLCQHLAGDASLDETAYEWDQIDRVMHKAKRNLRPLLRFISLQGAPANAGLLDTLALMSDAFSQGSPLPVADLPTSLVPTRLRRYVLGVDGTIVRDRYEFMVYRLVRERLEAGDLYCRDSARFRSFEDD
jgi:hypothetical protein